MNGSTISSNIQLFSCILNEIYIEYIVPIGLISFEQIA